jgi:hypothetical protein
MIMTIIGILVALGVLYWLGSLAYKYFTDPIERSRLNKEPVRILLALLTAVFLAMLLVGICIPPFGNLSILIGAQEFRVWAIGLAGCIVVMAVNLLTGRR